MALNGKKLMPREVAVLAYAAGWKDIFHVVEAVAVCTAESSRYTEANNFDSQGNPTNPDGTVDYGLWQINSVHFGKTIAGVQVTEATLLDPMWNVRIAHALWRANGWKPWAAHTSGRYLAAVPEAAVGVKNAVLLHFGLPLSTTPK